MTKDPLDELRTARPTQYATWSSSREGLDVMERALERGADDPPPTRSSKRVRSAFVVVIGSVVLGGVAAQAVGVPGFRDEPSKESLVSESDKGPLFPADDGAQPNDAQRDLSRRVTEILTPSVDGPKNGDGLPPQFAHGIVGFDGTPADGYTVIIGKGEDRDDVVKFVLEDLGPASSEYLTSSVADHSTSDLERVWRTIATQDWLDGRPSYSLDVDAGTGRIEMTVGADLSERDRAALIARAGDALSFRSGGQIVLGDR